MMNNSSIASLSMSNPSQFIAMDKNRSIRSDHLFLNNDVIFIQHQGEQYRLRRTRNGKLILTK
ncbi:Hemin uptake protein hemP [Nitrosomonas cryotolerans]|uniref:Hemin uptake protein hemP n=1 Tax=Nitrosomonas cryotolerans ATCC 49181 TaxID=1131553 RepID=A0A1N6J9F7_9PROT|nr:hemin uptake protein HemP [Nitrosomonas cryotolerans]SFP44151.1 Hemin uptake protein hemP [Nitrosomonas cryotolerans]SIO40756.1 Hemin uptake protein hemP [Nitrosomonas cryotolerans ATCC 49181]